MLGVSVRSPVPKENCFGLLGALEPFGGAPCSYLVQRGAKEQASEAATHGSTVQVAEHGLPQVLADTPPTAAWVAPSSRTRRVSRWRVSFFKLFFMYLSPFGQ